MNEYAKKYVCIKKDKEFRFLFKKGDSIVTNAFVCYARESKRRVNRIGIVTGKKVGNAVKRSRARRVIREAFRLIEPLLRGRKDTKKIRLYFRCKSKNSCDEIDRGISSDGKATAEKICHTGE